MGPRGVTGVPPFTHQALIYASEREFMATALPFIEEGIEAGEPVLVAVHEANTEALRDAVGPEARGLRLLSAEQWYENSARTKDKWAAWVTENSDGGRVRLIGEPPWPVGQEAQVRDWARYEAALNVAFAGFPVSLVCSYDARILPAEILEHAEHTHPEVMNGDGRFAESPNYEDPRAFCARLAADEDHARPPVAELGFGPEDLPAVRRLVEWEALYAGLAPERADELVLAVNELAANALTHGGSPADLRIWMERGELVFEVLDRGAGISDALAGQLRPPASGLGGRGLWLSRMMADALEIRSDADGNAVAVHAALPKATAATQPTQAG